MYLKREDRKGEIRMLCYISDIQHVHDYMYKYMFLQIAIIHGAVACNQRNTIPEIP